MSEKNAHRRLACTGQVLGARVPLGQYVPPAKLTNELVPGPKAGESVTS